MATVLRQHFWFRRYGTSPARFVHALTSSSLPSISLFRRALLLVPPSKDVSYFCKGTATMNTYLFRRSFSSDSVVGAEQHIAIDDIDFAHIETLRKIVRSKEYRYGTEKLQELKKEGWRPHLKGYYILLEGYIAQRDIASSMRLFEIYEQDEAAKIITGSTPVYALIFHGCMLKAFQQARLIDNAEQLFNKMKEKGLPMNLIAYNNFMQCYCAPGMAVRAIKLFETMLEEGIRPCNTTRTVLLKAIQESVTARDRSRDQTFRYRELQSKYVSSEDKSIVSLKDAFALWKRINDLGVEPDAQSYRMLLNLCIVFNDYGRATALFDRMKELHFLTVQAYNIMIKGTAKKLGPERAYDLFKQLKEDGLRPDATTYGTLIDAYLLHHRVEAALTVFKEMSELGLLRGHSRTYNTFIKHYVTRRNMEKALEVVDNMRMNNFEPDLYTFNILLSGYRQAGDVPSVLDLLDQMRKLSIRPDLYTFTEVIKTLCQQSQIEKAYEFLQEMRQTVRPIDSDPFQILISAALRFNNPELGARVINDLLEEGNNIQIDRIAFVAVFSFYRETGNLKGVLRVVETIKRLSLVVDARVYEEVMFSYLKLREMDKAYDLLIEQTKDANRRDATKLYGILLPHLLKCRMLRKAFFAAEKAFREGLVFDRELYLSLFNAAVSSKQLDKARMVVQEMKKRRFRGIPVLPAVDVKPAVTVASAGAVAPSS